MTHPFPHSRIRFLCALPALLGALWMPAGANVTGSTAVGDALVYRVTDRYTNEHRGTITYQVDKVESNRVVASVSSENSLVEAGRSAVFSGDGNWVRHALDSHGFPQSIEFAGESPAYAFPLTVGKRWSIRTPARVAETGERRSVRIDAGVVAAERVRVPAGEFDTLKITRIIYAGDGNNFESETHISQIEWYAPALRRAVKTEVRSAHFDNRIGRGNKVVRGAWDLHELVEVRAAKP